MNAHVQQPQANAPLSLSATEVDAAVSAAFNQLGHMSANAMSIDPERVQHDLAKLVLALVEFLRRLLELQAIRRMEAGTLTLDEEERIGTTLMLARERVLELADGFGLKPSDLNLDLGPLGRLC